MKFKIDENISKSAAYFLIENGHDAETVDYEKITGIEDTKLLKICLSENRCLITLDTDFANTKKYPPQLYRGIIVIKVDTQGKKEVNNLLRRLLPILQSENIQSNLWIVDKENIKIRSSP